MKEVFYKRGFTLIEVMIVVIIIAILSTIVFANISDARKRARDAIRLHDIREVAEALDLYVISNQGSAPMAGIISSHPSTSSQWESLMAVLGLVTRADPLNGKVIEPVVTPNSLYPYLSTFNYIYVKEIISGSAYSALPIPPTICARFESPDPNKVPVCNGGSVEPFSTSTTNNIPPLGCRAAFGEIPLDTVYGRASWICYQSGYIKR